MNKLYAALLAAFVSLGASPALADQSLSVSDYAQQGMPPLDRTWTAEDFDTAIRVLSALDPSQLPRSDSPRSAAVIDRIANPDSLGPCTDRSVDRDARSLACHRITNGALGVARIYAAALHKDHSFSDDAMRICGFLLMALADSADVNREIQASWGDNDPDAQTHQAAVARIREGTEQAELAASHMVADVGDYSDAARAHFGKVISDTFAQIAPVMDDSTRATVQGALHKAATEDPSSEVRAALARFATAP